jgi:addiction module HigA family antidote
MIPKQRRPTHPGEVLFKEFLEPKKISQVEFANRLSVPVQRINTLINGKRGITAETALLLAHELDTTPQFWMNLQNTWDLYEASKNLNLASA